MGGLAATLAALATLTGCAAPEPPGPPNVVIIFADDLGYADIAPFGDPPYETPHLQEMADEGTRLTDFYVSQPVCSASRASLLTGTYANRLGIHGALGPGARHGIHPDEVTLGDLFKSQGYATAIFGKWHLGHRAEFLPTRHGFDEFAGIPYSNDMWPFHPESPHAWVDLPSFVQEDTVGFNTDQRRFTTEFTKRGVDFIRRKSAESTPFFLYLPHPMPHVPLFVSEDREGASGAGLYGDVIHEIDWSVGQIRQALEEAGVAENTLVIFTSDNGPWLSYGDHAGSAEPLREGKGTAWDGGVRVPFIAAWPGAVPAGRVVEQPAMTIDILPALAELTGAELPSRPIDGKSIWPLLTGESDRSPQEAYFFWYRTNELHALRAGRWKLQFPHTYRTMDGQTPGAGGIPGKYDYSASVGLELFDLETDISESRNVADEHPEVMRRLTALADSARTELGDRLTGVEGRANREPGRLDDKP
ncbi:MAG: sulfatase [Rhodothermales bacterium]|nr:sulfatase [Rhodothermales bacterium]